VSTTITTGTATNAGPIQRDTDLNVMHLTIAIVIGIGIMIEIGMGAIGTIGIELGANAVECGEPAESPVGSLRAVDCD
jgi:hypothetical protein